MTGVGDLFENAATLSEQRLDAGSPLWPIVADTYLAAGYTIWYTPHEPMAERFWGEALRIQRAELPADHPDIATTISLLAGVLTRAGRASEAEGLVRESVAAVRRVHRPDSFAVATAESMLGWTLAQQAKFGEGEELLLRSHDIIMAHVLSLIHI